tara:strand:- start:570 stop:749 length:180 start_codon:yes stop_codon:yes gene_type:complete
MLLTLRVTETLDQVKRLKPSLGVPESNLITTGFRARNQLVPSKVQESELVSESIQQGRI